MCFYTWNELSTFIRVTPFEVFLFLVAITGTSFLLTVKLITESSFHLFSWWTVLSPLFIFDIVSAYFCVIIFIRQLHTGEIREALKRAFFSFKRIILMYIAKVLLIHKMEGALILSYSEVTLPLLFLHFMLIYRSLKMHDTTE